MKGLIKHGPEWCVALVPLVMLLGLATLLLGPAVFGSEPAVPDLSPVPPAVATEDDPGWDCLTQGNRTCRVGGVLVTSLDDMPPLSMPYERCIYLLKLSERLDPDFEFSITLCDSILVNG